MTGLSGVGEHGSLGIPVLFTANLSTACICGASFICVDIIVRRFPGKKGWRIQDSDVFLSISLSLSFGVMVCVYYLTCNLT